MIGPLLRVTGTVVVIAAALVTPVLATSAPASADIVVNGCTVVSNPTPTNFTDCPGADLSGANLSGVDLRYANLAGVVLVDCAGQASNVSCDAADLSGAILSDANLSSGQFANCIAAQMTYTSCAAVDLSKANLTDASLTGAKFAACTETDGFLQVNCDPANLSRTNLTNANLSNASFFSFEPSLNMDPNSTGVDLSGDILSGADLSGANMTEVDLTGATLTGANATRTNLDWSTLVNANLTNANLTNATLVCFFNEFFCGTANLTEANMTGATLTGANFRGATLTGTNFTGTLLVPPKRSVTAALPVVVTWPTPPSLPGATPGSCTPASGSFFPSGSSFRFGSTTVTCQVLDDQGHVAAGAFQVNVVPPPPSTSVLLPSNGATISDDSWLDAAASSPVGIASVTYEVSGGSISNEVVSPGFPTLFGWLGGWDATDVPNGTYTLQSVATDVDGFSTTSAPITVTVNNPPPSTSVLIPSNGTTLSGASALLDASAPGANSVTFALNGGTLSNQVIASGTLALWGWYAHWNSASVANGTYTLESAADEADGSTITSAPVTITVSN